jgi:hypothetical protein
MEEFLQHAWIVFLLFGIAFVAIPEMSLKKELQRLDEGDDNPRSDFYQIRVSTMHMMYLVGAVSYIKLMIAILGSVYLYETFAK